MAIVIALIYFKHYTWKLHVERKITNKDLDVCYQSFAKHKEVSRYTSKQLQKILKLIFVHNCYVEHYAKQNSSSHFYFVLQ